MLPDDANGATANSLSTRISHHTGNRHGCFPAPPRSPSLLDRKLPPLKQMFSESRTSGSSVLTRSAKHIRRTCRRQHWRHAKRLSPTISDDMILNWCVPEHTHMPPQLNALSKTILQQYMVKLVDVRRHFLSAHDHRGAFLIDAGLLRLASILRTATIKRG